MNPVASGDKFSDDYQKFVLQNQNCNMINYWAIPKKKFQD